MIAGRGIDRDPSHLPRKINSKLTLTSRRSTVAVVVVAVVTLAIQKRREGERERRSVTVHRVCHVHVLYRTWLVNSAFDSVHVRLPFSPRACQLARSRATTCSTTTCLCLIAIQRTSRSDESRARSNRCRNRCFGCDFSRSRCEETTRKVGRMVTNFSRGERELEFRRRCRGLAINPRER